MCVFVGAAAWGTVGSRWAGARGGAENYENGVSQIKIIKQGQMEILRQKLVWVGILN